MKTVIALIVLGILGIGSDMRLGARIPYCPDGRCQQVPTKPETKAQQIAYYKARYAASKGIKRHVLRSMGLGGGTVEGVGFSTSKRVPTCTPCNNPWCEGCRFCKCIGDSGPIRGPDGWYRCRIFR